MNKQQEIKIAKNIFAMTYGQLQDLYDKYESPDIMSDVMQELKRFSKLVTNETILKNDKEWWKIWKNDLNPTDIQDELLDAIAHKVFLNSLKVISGILEVKEKFDDLQVENINFANMTIDQINQLIEQCKKIAKKFKFVEKNKPKLIAFLEKMKTNSSDLDSRYRGDERYETIVKNKAVKKLLDDLKKTLQEVIDELNNSEEYKLEAPAITPRVKKSSLIKEAKVPQEGYAKALQKLIEDAKTAISTGNYRQESNDNSFENNLNDKFRRIDGNNVDFPQTLNLINDFVDPTKIGNQIKEIEANKATNDVLNALEIKEEPSGAKIDDLADKKSKYKDVVFEPSRVQGVATKISDEFNTEIFDSIRGKKFSEFYQHIDQYIKNKQKMIALFKNKIIPTFNNGFTVSNNGWFDNLANYCVNKLKEIKNKFIQELNNIDLSTVDTSIHLRTVKSYDSKKESFLAMKIAKSLMK